MSSIHFLRSPGLLAKLLSITYSRTWTPTVSLIFSSNLELYYGGLNVAVLKEQGWTEDRISEQVAVYSKTFLKHEYGFYSIWHLVRAFSKEIFLQAISKPFLISRNQNEHWLFQRFYKKCFPSSVSKMRDTWTHNFIWSLKSTIFWNLKAKMISLQSG